MDTIIGAPASCEVHAVICFPHAEGQSTAEIHRWLCHVYNDNVMSDSRVTEWCRKFRDGHTDVHDESGQGRHSIVTDELIQKVNQCVHEKRHFTKSELSEEFPQTLYRIVMDRLGYHKFCARWVSKTWMTFTKLKEWVQPWRFFSVTGKGGTNFLTESWLVTRLGYSLWMHRPNSSLNSGCTRILPTSPRYSNEHCRTKIWLLQYSGTVTEFYWQNSWHQRPQKCQGFIVKCWISFGGQSKTNGAGCSVRCRSSAQHAACTNVLIKLFNWEIFDHPPYSPELAPSDYHLFTKMKVWLATQCFHTNEKLMDGVNNRLHN